MGGILIAILSGALMSIQGVFNTGVTKQTSMWVTAATVQFLALVTCVIAWYVTGRESAFSGIFHIDHKYMLLGGVIGAFITYTVVQSMKSLGPAKSVMFIVVAQILVAYIIELLGWFGVEKVSFEWKKLFGMCIAIAGIILFKWES